ncbi:PLP-dependent transferase [Mycena floridula]|nr:PLP-dependent transferase [Mycena floridula]
MTSANLGFQLSRAVRSTISPPIPQAYLWARKYIPTVARPLLDMSQGVPGIPPQISLQQALGQAASSLESFGYCPAEGELSLRTSLAQEMRLIYGAREADITPQDLALTAGCNMAFIAAVMSVADAGDEVILPVPWYFNHQMSLNLLGISAVPLRVSAEESFMPSVERCKALITSKTRAIALVSPNNPTGTIYSSSLISAFAALAREHNIALIIDETYRDFIVTGPPHSLFSSDWRTNFISLYSFSKAYCIPGHRLGAIAASPVLIESIKTILDCLQICPPRPVQLALAPLLSSLRDSIRQTAIALQKRHELFKEVLPSRWIIGSQGGYYAFVKHPFIGATSKDVSRRLAEEMGVITLPSAFFDEEQSGTVEERHRWIRFSVANVDDGKVRKVCERLRESETRFDWPMST